MTKFLPYLLILGLSFGQILKFPNSTQGGLTILDLATGLIVIFALLRSKFHLKDTSLWIKTLGAFLIISLISLIFSPLKLTSTQYIFSLAHPLRLTLYLSLGYLISIGILPDFKKNIPKILTLSGLILALAGLLQLILLPNLSFLSNGGWDPHFLRTASTLLDPNFLGAFLVLTLIILTLDDTIFTNLKQKITAFLITYLAFVTTFSRSASIMFITSFLILAALKHSLKLFIFTLILTLGIGISFLYYRQTITIPHNIDRGQSAEYRVSSWQQGWNLWQSSPLLGIGFNSYRYALSQYHLASDNFINSRGASGNDSSLLFVAATTGTLGLITFISFLFVYIKESCRNRSLNKWNLAAISGIGGLLVNSFFINSLFYPWILIWIILISVAASSLKSSDTNH